MIYGYCRVSSKKQLDGNGLEVQEQEIKGRYPEAQIFCEQFTGKTTERPIFKKLISELKEGDLLVVSKLDRFCRTTVEGLATINELQNKKVNVHILNMGMIEDTPMGNLIITNLLAFAEFERALIIERTQAGKEVAKQDPNFKDGRPPKFKREQRQHALKLLNETYIDENGEVKNRYTVQKVSEITGISVATLHRIKREAKVKKIESELKSKPTITQPKKSEKPVILRKENGEIDCDNMSDEALLTTLDESVYKLVEFANTLSNLKIDSTEHKLIDLCSSEVLRPLSNGFIATDGLDYFKTEDEIQLALDKGYKVTFLIDNLPIFILPIEKRLNELKSWKSDGFNYYKRMSFGDNPTQIENEDELTHLHFNIDDAIELLENFLKNVPNFDGM